MEEKITVSVFLEDETTQKFNSWLEDCFQKLDSFYSKRARKSGIIYQFHKPVIGGEDTRSYILAAYKIGRRIEREIILKWIEVGTRLKVVITFPFEPKTISPVWDILSDLYHDFPEMKEAIPNILQDLKNKYHFDFSLLPLNGLQPLGLDAAKLEKSQVIDNPGFEIIGSWELSVDWDVLVSASDSCLDRCAQGFVDKEIIKQLPASIVYRIWQKELGELGTIEIRKLGDEKSQINISGVPLGAESLANWEQTVKDLQGKPREVIHKALEETNQKLIARRAQMKNHQAEVVEAYFGCLKQERIWQDSATSVQSTDHEPGGGATWGVLPEGESNNYIDQRTVHSFENVELLMTRFVRLLKTQNSKLNSISYKKIQEEEQLGRFNIYDQGGEYLGCAIFFPLVSDQTTIAFQWVRKNSDLFNRIMVCFEETNENSKKIAEKFKSGKVIEPLGKPYPPETGSSVAVWLDYYHAMKKVNYKISFKNLSELSGYSANTFKQANGRYKLERGID